MKPQVVAGALLLGTLVSTLSGCSTPLPWPEGPLYASHAATTASAELSSNQLALAGLDKTALKQAVVGRYGHFDVVAYEDLTQRVPMRSFVITYGITDFALEGDELIETDLFCHAEYQLNQPMVSSEFSPAATQAILPRSKQVDVARQADGQWQLFRAATPTLIGIAGDPLQPIDLTTRGDAPGVLDEDNDGKPGVTVQLTIAGLFSGEIYIARREIFNYYMVPQADGSMLGYVDDKSEQAVLGASWKMLDTPSNPHQHPDKSLSPLILIPLDQEIQTCDQLMAQRDELFPPVPKF